MLLQEAIQFILAAEVGGRVAQLAHHIAAHVALALEVVLDHAVVADQREGLHHDLSRIAGVGQGLQIAHHARGEHQLAQAARLRADADALVHAAVGQHQISLRHK